MKKLLILASLLAVAPVAFAADPADMQINTNVSGSCTLSAPAQLAFGNYDPTGVHRTAALEVNGQLQIQCTQGTQQVMVYLSKGTYRGTGGQDCTSGIWRMTGVPLNDIGYLIYKDTTKQQIWGCNTTGTGGKDGVTFGPFTNGLTPISHTFTGSIWANQNTVAVGNYSDTVRFYVNF